MINGHKIYGVIDRLVVTDDTILAVDFKSNATTPHQPEQVPEGILRQMGAYGQMLASIYPDHHIDLAVLWTRTGQVMSLSSQLCHDALQRSGILDGNGTGS